MTALVFVDTNVVVYARDPSEPDKQRQASAWLDVLWDTGLGRISSQVLSEYYNTVTRKLDPGVSRSEAVEDVRALMQWQPVELNERLFERAWSVEDRYGLSWWDCLIVAAAQVSGCETLLTEDLQAGQDFDGVRVVDPFATSPAETGL